MATDIDELQIQIQGSAKSANSSVTALIKRLEKLSNVINGIDAKKVNNLGTGLNSVGKGSKSASAGLDKTAASAKKATSNFNSLASAFGKFYATYFLFIRGAKSVWKGIESSMDYVETSNYFSVALGEIGKQFEEAGFESAELYTDALVSELSDLNSRLTGYTLGSSGEALFSGDVGLGMDIEQLMNFQAKTLAVTNSVGLMGEASLETAKAVSMLAGDLSSLTNTDLESVMTNLSSGLIGQSRSLYKYGIDITQNTLQQYALAEGIEKAVSEMTQAEKMQLRLLAILDQSSVAHSDLAITINSVANQYRVFDQQIDNTGRTLGNLFLPIVQNVLPWVNGLIIAINNLLTSIGFEVYGENWLKDLQEGISGGAQEGFEDLEGSVDDATDSLNKFKKSARGFDELNILTGGTSVGSGVLGELEGQIDLTDRISDAVADYENAWNDAFSKAENKANEFAETLTNAFIDLDSGEITAISAAFAGIASSAVTLAGITGISKTATVISSFFGLIAAHPYVAIATGIAGVAGALITWYNSLETVDSSEIEKATSELEKSILDIDTTFSDFKTTVDELNSKRNSVGEAIDSYYELLENPNIDFSEKENQLKSYVEYITKEFPGLSSFVDSHTGLFTANKNEILANVDALTEYARNLALQDFTTQAYKELYEAQAEYSDFLDEYKKFEEEFERIYALEAPGTGTTIMSERAYLSGDYQKLKEYRKQNEEYLASLSEYEERIKKIESGDFTFFETVNESAIEASEGIEEVSEAFVTAEEKIEALSWATELFSKDTTELTNKLGKFGEVLENLKSNAVKGFIDEIERLNEQEINIPVTIGGGGSGNGLELGRNLLSPNLSLRAYAGGGMVTAGEVFVARENGTPELVGNFGGQVGVANNGQIIQGIRQAAYEGFLAAISQSGSSSGGDIIINMDGKEVFRVVRSRANEHFRKTGKSAFDF